MYGWRGRLGLIVPSSNSTNEPEFARWLPDGVSLHTARMRLEGVDAESLGAMADEIERCTDLLATADVDAIAYGCTTGSLVHGPGYDEEIEGRIESAADVPAVATAASVKRAFARLRLERLAITTPYVEDLNDREVKFLTDAGYTLTASASTTTLASASRPPRRPTGALGRCRPRTPTGCSSAVRTTGRSRLSHRWRQTWGCRSSRATKRRSGTRSGASMSRPTRSRTWDGCSGPTSRLVG
jgi:maleate isomerase